MDKPFDKQNLSVLVVDDVNVIRIHVKALLRAYGFNTVEVAGSVPEAQRMLESQEYQLVMCDWHMYGPSGLDFLRFVRKHPKFSKLVFVMMTAESTKEKVLEAVTAGVDNYVIKPLTPQVIESKIITTLQKRQLLA